MTEEYATQLRERGFRMTPQRRAILRILQKSACHLAPLEVYQQAEQAVPGLTEATVYRTLSFLCEQGLALAAHIGSGQLVYEIAERPHHHLVCRACGCSYEIPHSELKALFEHFQEKTGFKIDTMHVTFFGLCPQCRKD